MTQIFQQTHTYTNIHSYMHTIPTPPGGTTQIIIVAFYCIWALPFLMKVERLEGMVVGCQVGWGAVEEEEFYTTSFKI